METLGIRNLDINIQYRFEIVYFTRCLSRSFVVVFS